MNYITYMPFFILTYLSLKLLSKFIDENILSLKEQIIKQEIEKGILSIKDLRKDNQERFIDSITLYLSIQNYKNLISPDNNTSGLINYRAILDNDDVYISCIMNDIMPKSEDEDDIEFTTKEDVQMFLGRMTSNCCKKGLFINNSSFSQDALEFVKTNNNNSDYEIRLIDGYELTKSLRQYRNSNNMEVRYGDK